MADIKIQDATTTTVPALTNKIPVYDGTEAATVITPAQIIAAGVSGGLVAPALGADDNYVTDAEKTKLANLSGTNTGDQDLTGLLNETAHDLLDHTGLPGVPAAYTLPTASAMVLGGVKVDGSTILISNGVISSTGGSGGGGDMFKAVYDTDNDGVVDAAEAVPWAGVTDKPSTFPPDLSSVNHIAFDTTPSAVPTAAGVQSWNPTLTSVMHRFRLI